MGVSTNDGPECDLLRYENIRLALDSVTRQKDLKLRGRRIREADIKNIQKLRLYSVLPALPLRLANLIII